MMACSPGEPVRSRILDGFSKLEVSSILGAATFRRYSSGVVVLNQEDPAEHFLLLRTGCARLFYVTQEGRKVLLRWLGPGEILGGAAILPMPTTYLVSTEMVKDSSVFGWRRERIRSLVARYPRLLDNALPFALDHLTWFLAAQLALISKTARERLAQVLLSLAEGIGHKISGGIQLDITNEQLANAANITPFTASRLLSEWQRSGAILKTRGMIMVHAPERLLLHPALE
ncbi:MAG TPA: Crp/Fnr family transcriptional regulator [Terriglobales bacterium]|nr:Crp/Fnr family transcriptional regulator [Terriglobales bacterium]